MRRDDDVEDGGPISHGKISSLQLHMRDDEREEERESSVVGLGKITEIMTAAKQQLGDPAEICGKGEKRGRQESRPTTAASCWCTKYHCNETDLKMYASQMSFNDHKECITNTVH